VKIAVTADVHLTGDGSHPERLHALEDIFLQMLADGYEHLIIAGDLFDRDYSNCSEFDRLCSRPEYSKISIMVIPGNHDPDLSTRKITAANVRIFNSPTVHRLKPDEPEILFVPCEPGLTMGQRIAEIAPELDSDRWILVGHGDYTSGSRMTNPYEPGLYMPLTRSDIQQFKPSITLLGHIHKPVDTKGLHYPGSPCGIDINETGRRRFLVLDTDTLTVESQPVNTDLLFFRESFLVIPSEEEEIPRLKTAISSRIESWNLLPGENSKVQLRVQARGYTTDRSAIKKTLKEGFRGFSLHSELEPDVSGLSQNPGGLLTIIAEKVIRRIEDLELPAGPGMPDREMIIEEALGIVFGGL